MLQIKVKPTCVCQGIHTMRFLMDNKLRELFECPKCGRLLLRFKNGQTSRDRWFNCISPVDDFEWHFPIFGDSED